MKCKYAAEAAEFLAELKNEKDGDDEREPTDVREEEDGNNSVGDEKKVDREMEAPSETPSIKEEL